MTDLASDAQYVAFRRQWSSQDAEAMCAMLLMLRHLNSSFIWGSSSTANMQVLRAKIGRHRSFEWVTRLLVLAFALRALVPVGFMPDISALSKGVLKVVICTSSGSKVITLDADGKPSPTQKVSHAGETCAFAGIAAINLPVLDGIKMPSDAADQPIFVAATTGMLPPARAGPPVGAQAPPVSL